MTVWAKENFTVNLYLLFIPVEIGYLLPIVPPLVAGAGIIKWMLFYQRYILERFPAAYHWQFYFGYSRNGVAPMPVVEGFGEQATQKSSKWLTSKKWKKFAPSITPFVPILLII